MNIDYNYEIIKLVGKLKDCNEYKEVIDDYNNIVIIKNNILIIGKINENESQYINYIRNKYDEDIKIISNIRFNFYSIIGKPANIEDNNIYNEVSFLLDYLPRILIYRVSNNHLKDNIKEDIKNSLYCEDSKIAFEVFSNLIEK